MVSLVALLFAHPRLDVVRLNPLNSLLDWSGWLAHVVMPVGWFGLFGCWQNVGGLNASVSM